MSAWQVDAAVLGGHVHVTVRSPGPAGHRPYAGTLIVAAEDWPALRAALASLP